MEIHAYHVCHRTTSLSYYELEPGRFSPVMPLLVLNTKLPTSVNLLDQIEAVSFEEAVFHVFDMELKATWAKVPKTNSRVPPASGLNRFP